MMLVFVILMLCIMQHLSYAMFGMPVFDLELYPFYLIIKHFLLQNTASFKFILNCGEKRNLTTH